jgi:hypothetical protein
MMNWISFTVMDVNLSHDPNNDNSDDDSGDSSKNDYDNEAENIVEKSDDDNIEDEANDVTRFLALKNFRDDSHHLKTQEAYREFLEIIKIPRFKHCKGIGDVLEIFRDKKCLAHKSFAKETKVEEATNSDTETPFEDNEADTTRKRKFLANHLTSEEKLSFN